MVNQILEYEKFLKSSARKKMKMAEFLELHTRMIQAFQHERLIHLLVTLFFGFLAVTACIIAGFMMALYGFDIWMAPMYILAVILVVLEMFYVKHYYFLENHIQKMYKYFML